MADINIKYQYPNDPNYIYETRLERVNLDEERKRSLASGNGFIISEPQSTLKKDLKNPNGIYSTKFGTTLQDINPFADRYKCQCGHFKSRIYNGILCPICNTKVKYVDDNFDYFGWIVLKDPYYIIHPNLYKSIDQLLGQNKQKQDIIENILKPHEEKNEDGFIVNNTKNKDEPFYGIGMLQFKERFDEIMKFYLEKKKFKKQEYYDDIMNNKEKIFIQSIPVYTTHLRPYKVDGISFFFEGTNSIYNIMAKLSVAINKDDIKIFRKLKTKNQLLFDLNNKYQELYAELENIISGKKGTIRTLFGGRYNFTSRDVIVPNPKLRIDEVTMPYVAMVELLQQTIINILQKSYNMSYSEAYRTWYMSKINKNDIIAQIIKGLIKSTVGGYAYTSKGKVPLYGIPVLINRNPTMDKFRTLENNVA